MTLVPIAGRLHEHARHLRSYNEARISPFLTADTYHILTEPIRGEYEHAEMTWPEMTSRRMMIDRIKQIPDAAYVIFKPVCASPSDISDRIARELASMMAQEGHEYDAIASVKFISRNLVDSDILALTGGR